MLTDAVGMQRAGTGTMPDRYPEWDDYRLQRRSEPIPPEGADAEAFSPAAVWASSKYAGAVRPGDPNAHPSSPLAPQSPPGRPRSKMRFILLGVAGLAVLTALIAAPVVTH